MSEQPEPTPSAPTPVAIPEPRPFSEPQAGVASARGVYVYGVYRTQKELSFGAIGLGTPPARVGTVCHRELGAVVSDGPAGVPDPTRDNVLAHQRVQEVVLDEHTLLPMAFGITLRTRDEVVELLRSAYDAFDGVLQRLEGHVELGLKVLWDRDRVARDVEAKEPELGSHKEEPPGSPGRVEYERRMEEALRQRAERDAQALVDTLRPMATAARVVSPLGERMILNAAFLVSREREAAFDAKVRALAARFELLTFQFTGPWAPYHFVDIRLRLEHLTSP
ncbi:GvpL/GvpF family gas vesicle protein [Hyalangium rubrum]|uniref:GvpL/GvpF family gas vesicle protein n=1 Tax=Hyalangium rubrum TaxID=3103134 RepID=A0ABU5H772_9BACT|nr:GvpL/GvpF family gas vesicle protein [Hyalangium sp. s54d21]MDY7229111.1 GvpL/GvpF family gas vesicle protein [Hyalangium sp. s54d21]